MKKVRAQMLPAALVSCGSLKFREPFYTSSDIQSSLVGPCSRSPPKAQYRLGRDRSQPKRSSYCNRQLCPAKQTVTRQTRCAKHECPVWRSCKAAHDTGRLAAKGRMRGTDTVAARSRSFARDHNDGPQATALAALFERVTIVISSFICASLKTPAMPMSSRSVKGLS